MTTKKANERKCAISRLESAIKILEKCHDSQIGIAIAQIAVALHTLASALMDVDWASLRCFTKYGSYMLCLVCPQVAQCNRAAEYNTGLAFDEDFESCWTKDGDCFGFHPPKGLFVPECYQMCQREEACEAETLKRASK